MATLLDQYGRPIATASLKAEQAAPTMMGVRRPNADHQVANLTPGKLGRLLRESVNGNPEAYLGLAEDMEERDLHYAGVLSTRKLQVAGLDIAVEAATDAPDDVRQADLVRAVIERDAFQEELVDILDAVGKGFSATEILWDTSEGQWRPAALKWRDPRWFRFRDEDGETPLLRDVSGDVPLAPFKWIFHCAKVKSGLPVRGGIARAVCWTFLFKSFTGKDWAIFCEAYGQPLRLGKYGEGASESDKETLLRAVSNIGVDYSAIVPTSMTVEFIKADVSGSHELYEKRADWLDRQVSKIVLGQTGTTDAVAGGYAVGKVHDGVRADIERSDARQLAASLNRDLVRPLIDLNFGPQKTYPRITIGRPEELDLAAWMANVKIFVDMGGKVGMSTVRDKIGIPDPADDEELLTARAPSPEQTLPGKTPEKIDPKGKQAVARALPQPEPSDAIDRSVEDMLADDGWEPLVAPMLDGLEAKIAASASADEARAVLADHFRAMDVEALADILARATFAARLAGEYDDDLGGDPGGGG